MMAKPTIRREWIPRAVTVLLIGWVFVIALTSAAVADGVSTEAGPEGPAQTAYAPANGPGPVIIVISGLSGPASYQTYAAELARLGYYSVLLTGKDILNTAGTGPANLRKAIDRAQHSPSAIKGKTAVIGFSLGGGGALYNATIMPDLVSVVIAYYPYTRTWSNNIGSLVKRFKVPVLVMAGQQDRYMNCCVIDSMRAMEIAAKEYSARFELVVYPEATHGFNLEIGARGEPAGAYRRDDDRDAWRRTVEMLKQYHPLP
jgi:dienelactone hydrolase